jgi:hypothetical protein
MILVENPELKPHKDYEDYTKAVNTEYLDVALN